MVEDDRDTREVLHLVLEDAGYTVAEATDGLEGLAAIQASEVPLVVLLDLDLPQLDGIAVLQEVARDARLAARHAFLLLTAISYQRYEAATAVCAQLGVPLLAKPFQVEALLDLVATAARRLASAPPEQR